MKYVLIFAVKFYQLYLSPFMGRNCRFVPTCSEYAVEALRRYGALRGLWLSMRRLVKCGPWHHGGHDPVPRVKD